MAICQPDRPLRALGWGRRCGAIMLRCRLHFHGFRWRGAAAVSGLRCGYLRFHGARGALVALRRGVTASHMHVAFTVPHASIQASRSSTSAIDGLARLITLTHRARTGAVAPWRARGDCRKWRGDVDSSGVNFHWPIRANDVIVGPASGCAAGPSLHPPDRFTAVLGKDSPFPLAWLEGEEPTARKGLPEAGRPCHPVQRNSSAISRVTWLGKPTLGHPSRRKPLACEASRTTVP